MLDNVLPMITADNWHIFLGFEDSSVWCELCEGKQIKMKSIYSDPLRVTSCSSDTELPVWAVFGEVDKIWTTFNSIWPNTF